MTLHPEILVKNGKKQFAVLPYEEFLAVQQRLADAEDILELRKAKRGRQEAFDSTGGREARTGFTLALARERSG